MARPFTVTRSTTINAPAERIYPLVADFHHWVDWSPWEGMDPDLTRRYSGAESGEGAHCAWSGNRKAGEGSMTITNVTPNAHVAIDLHFTRPFPAKNKVELVLTPQDGGATDVEWLMSGTQKGVMAVFGRIVPMDKMVGKDFEKGLARLKALAGKQ